MALLTMDQDSGTSTGQDLRVGAACSADFTYSPEVSCGLMGFGDVRFHCRSETPATQCPRTRSVTLENTGSARVRLVVISGSRPGERNDVVTPALLPGARAVIAPRSDETYLYDIVMRTFGGSARVKITDVSNADVG
ncbi:hypothetical protein AB0O67_05070 [Streptomyces sp. NPDC086077]|uniref:hypothetical protein n=1 Tax=Streptomyces sp. NPDC086077 TaxID=3154862 RepID=UPI003432C83E